MTRYRSKTPALRSRQDAVFSSQRLSLMPRPSGPWRVIARDGTALTGDDGGSYEEACEMARVMGDGAIAVPLWYPVTCPKVAARLAALRPRREEAWDLERTSRRAEARAGRSSP